MSSRGVMSANLGLPPPLCFALFAFVHAFAQHLHRVSKPSLHWLCLGNSLIGFSCPQMRQILVSIVRLVLDCKVSLGPLLNCVIKATTRDCVSFVVDALDDVSYVIELVGVE